MRSPSRPEVGHALPFGQCILGRFVELRIFEGSSAVSPEATHLELRLHCETEAPPYLLTLRFVDVDKLRLSGLRAGQSFLSLTCAEIGRAGGHRWALHDFESNHEFALEARDVRVVAVEELRDRRD